MKEYMCTEVKHHKDVGEKIEEWQRNGWCLHTYCSVNIGIGSQVNHYLLFEKGE